MCFPLFLVILHYLLFVSVASDVDPSNVVGSAVADKDAADQTSREQPVEQPTVVPTAETAEEDPAQDNASPEQRCGGRRQGPNTPPAEEKRAPTPVPAEASTPEGSPSRGKGPMIPVTVAGGAEEGAEAQAASDDEVEEIQGRPHNGRQHVYMWRQRGDHWAAHEELAETEEAARVERAAKRLINEVKVNDPVFYQSMYILLLTHCMIRIFLAGCNKNGEVPKKVLRPN